MQVGRYKNYKGNFYEVLGIALSVEDQQKMVIYRALYDIPELTDIYGAQPTFVRPHDIIFGSVEVNGKSMPRMEYVGD